MILCFKKTTALTFATWFFIAIFFADFANLDDIVPETTVTHPEEVGISDGSSGSGAISDNLQSKNPIIPLKLSVNPLTTARQHIIKIVDLDSPSLAADPTASEQVIYITSVEQDAHFLSHIPSLRLYLLHCKFLI